MSTKVMQETIAEYFKTQPVLKAWLFGSFARGEETPRSDVDILFVPDRSTKPFTLFTHGGMLMDLQERIILCKKKVCAFAQLLLKVVLIVDFSGINSK